MPDDFLTPFQQAAQLPQPDVGASLMRGIQEGLQQQVARQQMQRQLQQQQTLDAATREFIANPTAQNIRTLAALNPQGFAAIKTAHDQLSGDQQKQDLQDLAAIRGQLSAGSDDGIDKALSIVQARIDAHAKSGQDTSNLQQMADAIKAHPKQALDIVNYGLAAVLGPDKFAEAFNTEETNQRADAKMPGDIALTAAQTAQANAEADKAKADAAKAAYITANPDQTVLKVGSDVAPPPQGSAPAAAGSDASRGVRNNNPLNVTTLPDGKWAGQTGADGKFAVFSSPQAGMAAADKNLQSYGKNHGINTVAGIINRWSPAGDGANDPGAYAAAVSADLGVHPDTPLDLSDPVVRKSVLTSMAKIETGPGITPPAASAAAPGQLKPVFQGASANSDDKQLDPDAIAMIGQQYLRNGPSALVNMGQGPSAVQNKNRVMDWVAKTAKEAGTSNPELVARFAQNKANSSALVTNTKALTAISASEGTLNANLDFAQQLAKRGLGPTGIPLADMPLNKLRAQLGNADVKTLDNVLKTSADEYARILTMGPSGGGGATSVEATKQAQGLINNGMTLRQLTSAIGAAKTEAENRKIAYSNESARLTSEISGVPYRPAAPATQQSDGLPTVSPADAAKLPKGTRFRTTDGRVLVRQ